MKNFKNEIIGTETTTVTGIINYLRTILRGEAIWEFDELKSQVTGTTNTQINFIKECLLEYFSVKALTKQNHAMWLAMCEPRDLPFKKFSTKLM